MIKLHAVSVLWSSEFKEYMKQNTETEREQEREGDTHTACPAAVKTEQEAGRKLRAIRDLKTPETVSLPIALFLHASPICGSHRREERVKEGGAGEERLNVCKPCSGDCLMQTHTHRLTHTDHPTLIKTQTHLQV